MMIASGENKNMVRRTTLILLGCMGLLLGIFASKYISPLASAWIAIPILLFPLLFGKPTVRITYIIVAMFVIGAWRGGILQSEYQQLASYYGTKTTVVGRALEDASYSYNGQLETTVDVDTVNNQPISGRITVRGHTLPAIYRYDGIEATGKLYPTMGGKQGTMSYADMTVVSNSESLIEDLRRNFIVGMENAIPEPAASFGIGLLVGQRSLLPEDVATALRIAGLTHIVAVSGYNLTIIVNAVRRSSRKLSRFQTVAISAGLIYTFLLITGFSPSIVRASIVAGLGIAAWYYGRSFRPLLLIVFTAALTGFANPYYVWGDIGWYLSFLAFFGVLILAPLLTATITKSNRELPILPTVAIESFSAQIMTVPLVMFVFGKLSIIGFISNIIIVPLVPLAMLFSVIAGIAGMIIPAFAGWFGLPARILLGSMLNIAEWFASWPHAVALLTISAGSMLILYFTVGIWLLALKKRTQTVIL